VDLTIETVSYGSTAVVSCRGGILHGATARRFRRRISHVLSRHRRLVIDLGGLSRMDARGVGMLAVLIGQAKSLDARLVLAAPRSRVRHLLRVTRLETQVECVAIGSVGLSRCADHLGRADGGGPDRRRPTTTDGRRTGRPPRVT
jgi:anti-anti-sigma factor